MVVLKWRSINMCRWMCASHSFISLSNNTPSCTSDD